jgi:hypothetical protein
VVARFLQLIFSLKTTCFMKLLLSIFSASMLMAASANAQQFINGSFEPKTTITACTDAPVATYNANMGGNWARGSATTMQVANASCGQGSPDAGSYFGVFKYAGAAVDGNRIVFKLDKPRVMGTQYKVTLKYKVPTGTPAATASLVFGYTSDSTTNDSTSGSSEPISNTTWMSDTLKITPKKASQFVWMELRVLGGDPYTVHVDNVNMNGIPPVASVGNLLKDGAVRLAPNPVTDISTLTLGGLVSLPCNVVIYDITGRIVQNLQNINTRSVALSKAEMETGIYMLKLTDNQQQTYTTRISVQ